MVYIRAKINLGVHLLNLNQALLHALSAIVVELLSIVLAKLSLYHVNERVGNLGLQRCDATH